MSIASLYSGLNPIALAALLGGSKPQATSTEAEAKSKEWVNVPFLQGFDGLLSAHEHSSKRMIVKHPKDNPHVLAIDIRRWYSKTNRPSKEGIFLMADEYDYLVFMINRARTETFTIRNDLGTRTLTIGPNPEVGGVRVVQTTHNKVKYLNFLREEIKVLTTKYKSSKDRAADSFDIFVDKPSGELLDDEVAIAKAQGDAPYQMFNHPMPSIKFDESAADTLFRN